VGGNFYKEKEQEERARIDERARGCDSHSEADKEKIPHKPKREGAGKNVINGDKKKKKKKRKN